MTNAAESFASLRAGRHAESRLEQRHAFDEDAIVGQQLLAIVQNRLEAPNGDAM